MPIDRQQLTECDKAAIHSVELVIEAMENLQVVLSRRVELLRRSIEFAEPAADYEKAVKDSHMTEEREDLQEALNVLEQRRARLALGSLPVGSGPWCFDQRTRSHLGVLAPNGLPLRKGSPRRDLVKGLDRNLGCGYIAQRGTS